MPRLHLRALHRAERRVGVSAAGKIQSSGNSKLSWTVGEPVVGLMTSGGNQLGNGYYPALNIQALSIGDETIDVQLRVYPNPTSHSLYVTHLDISSFGVQIVDLNGKQLYSGTINTLEPLDVSSYTQGMYIVTIENKTNKKKNSYKIIKE